MEKQIPKLLCILAACFLVISCDYYNENNPPDPSTIVAQNVTWQQVSMQLFQPRCAACHSQGGAGFNSSNYQDVISMLGQVEERVLVRKSMPPDSALTPYETTLLQDWISNNTPYGTPGSGQ